MSSPRFRPRGYSTTPDGFGWSRRMDWIDDSGLSEDRLDQLGAAKLQHEFAWRVRDALQGRNLSVKEFAAMEGQDYFRWRRLLRGEVIMRVEDIARAERALEIRLTHERRYGSMEQVD